MKFTPGPIAGALSGSLGATVASHNRGGTYFRVRAIPVISTTTFATNAKAHLGGASSDWGGLTDSQRLAWEAYAQETPVVDTLGAKRILTGHMNFVGLNSRIARDAGTPIVDPPLTQMPSAILTAVLELDIGTGDFDIEFTPTPLAADIKLWLRAAVVNSAGINYVQNLLKQVLISPAAQASPVDFETELEARFGTLIVGQKVVVFAHQYNSVTGQLSQPHRSEGLILDTP